MKVLSIKSPFSWLILTGMKDVENRSWTTDYRGPVFIHSSGQGLPELDKSSIPAELLEDYKDFKKNKGINVEFPEQCGLLQKFYALIEYFNGKNEVFLKAGMIIGYVELRDVVPETLSIWGNLDKFNWVFSKPRILVNPLEIKGKLGLWKIDDELMKNLDSFAFDVNIKNEKFDTHAFSLNVESPKPEKTLKNIKADSEALNFV